MDREQAHTNRPKQEAEAEDATIPWGRPFTEENSPLESPKTAPNNALAQIALNYASDDSVPDDDTYQDADVPTAAGSDIWYENKD